MARTRALDYDDKLSAILDSAALTIASKSYPTTSMNDIAEACGVSKGRIYYYFESKETILFEILKRHVETLAGACEDIIDRGGDPRARFEELIHAVLGIYSVSREKHVILMTSLQFLPTELAAEIVKRERELVSLMETLIKRLPGKPAAKGGSRVVVMLLFGMLNWTYTWYRPGGAVSVKSLADQAVSIFLDGYLPRKA